MKEPIAYQYDFVGAYDPTKKSVPFSSETFSVGVFQWLLKSTRKGLKKSAVVKRFRGPVSHPEEVHAAAQAYCDKMNSQNTKQV